VLFHLAYWTKDQKFLPTIHARTGHEHKTPNSFSCARDFIFLATLIHPLSFSHCFCSFPICAENTKGPIELGLSKPCLDTLLLHSNYTKIALQKPIKTWRNHHNLSEKSRFNTSAPHIAYFRALTPPRFS
jgi:hypothetical protein